MSILIAQTFTQNFEDFSAGLKPVDLALYAGIGLVVWLMFKDRVGGVKGVTDMVSSWVGGLVSKPKTETKPEIKDVSKIVNDTLNDKIVTPKDMMESDDFFSLVVSWKRTRDLAEKCSCTKAVEVADQMFPFLSPNVCAENNDE